MQLGRVVLMALILFAGYLKNAEVSVDALSIWSLCLSLSLPESLINHINFFNASNISYIPLYRDRIHMWIPHIKSTFMWEISKIPNTYQAIHTTHCATQPKLLFVMVLGLFSSPIYQSTSWRYRLRDWPLFSLIKFIV